ncbi:tetratricopeptide repeat protein [Neptunomonas antarctica]|uniref:TPR repeat n=1 Tax=Neptunomonas antarctica TaxID=619304 RepID=A0A1N7J7A3_9GAMM|nr:tetratricopeptide repeat protein [Neptunomonas antarctica]SIS45147.1 TPR repeat [Neptunomonas antarctica]
MKSLFFIMLIAFTTILSGCFVGSKTPLFTDGDDLGVSSNTYALKNTSNEVSMMGLLLLSRKGNTHQFHDALIAATEDRSIIDLYQGSLVFKKIPSYSNYFLIQNTQVYNGENIYSYWLAHKKERRLQISMMKLNNQQLQIAKKSGLKFSDGKRSVTVDSKESLIEYAQYWLELKGSDWVSDSISEKTLADGDRQSSFQIIESQPIINTAKQHIYDQLCLIAAGHPDDTDVQALPAPNAKGVRSISQIKPEAMAFCRRESLNTAPFAVQYALARAYFQHHIYLPKGSDEGSLAISKRLVAAGDPLAHILLASHYLSGTGVEKNLAKAQKILEQSAPHPAVLASLGYYYLYGYLGKKDEQQAKVLFEQAIELGSVIAMGRLGLMYQNGLGIEKDQKKGLTLIIQAANKGDSEAQYYLGNTYYYARGTPLNYTRALSNYKKAAAGNYARAMYALGFMYYQGQGVEASRIETLSWLRKGAKLDDIAARDLHSEVYYNNPATVDKNDTYQKWLLEGAESGNPRLQFLLGSLYENGREQQSDKHNSRALFWYQKAANQGHNHAQYASALILLKLRNHRDALEYLTKASAENFALATLKLGDLHTNGLSSGNNAVALKADIQKAISYYEMAAQQGNSNGLLKAGMTYYSGRIKGIRRIAINKTKALNYFKQAAASGIPRAQGILGSIYQYGDGVAQDYKKAFNLYQKAAAQDDTESIFALGTLYQYGYGVKQDYAQAITWYNKASAKQYPRSWNNLGILIEKGRGTKRDLPNAINFYQLAADKGIAEAHGNLARIWATEPATRNADKAFEHAKTAIEIQDKAYFHELLAAAYAAKGQFQDAIAEQATAIAMSARSNFSHPIQDYRLKLYREHKRLTCVKEEGPGCF